VGRKTQGERIRKKLKALSVRLAALRTLGGKAMLEHVRRHLQGHIQYFGVSGNSRSLQEYVYQAGRRKRHPEAALTAVECACQIS
jgi:hypothetical protein